MNIVTVGIDLAKNVFALHGVDQYGKAIFIKPKVVRGQLLEMVAQLPPCLIPQGDLLRGRRHGSLFRRAPLGKRIQPLRPHRQTDGPQIRGAVPDEWQAREERCC